MNAPDQLSGWDLLMGAPQMCIPRSHFDEAVGWATARAQHRQRRQRIHLRDINGQPHWVIHDVATIWASA